MKQPPINVNGVAKKRHIAFWILFPIAIVLLGGLLLFWLDMANGPIYLIPLAFGTLLALVVTSIVLLSRRIYWRLIPWGAFALTIGVLVPLAKPDVAVFPAVVGDNVEKTAVLHLNDGDIQGVYSLDHEVEVYAGIPYAAPPVGEYRWRAPQPVTPWEGVRDASVFAPRSMQPSSNALIDSLVDLYAEKAWRPDFTMHPVQNMSEDSLYLNVWKPAGDVHDLPVLMFIHGGSLTSGSSAFSDYNGEAMAHEGIIMITIQYRLGVFGYFAHPDLEAECPAGEKTTGNYGLLDQIAALRWIQDNIASFGGDKTKVTIAGESAGSSSISALCSSPLAHGLFRYAIGESSSLVVPKAPHTFRKKEEAMEVGQKILAEQGCSSIAELRNVSAETLVKTAYANSGMTLDDYALPKHPYEVYQEGMSNEEALLNGYNVKEADAFVIPNYLFSPTNKDNIRSRLLEYFDEEATDELMALYHDRIESDAFSAFNEIFSVYWFIEPHDRWSKMALGEGLPVYRYQFTKENGYYGTYHSGEMIYAYGNLGRSRHGYAYDEKDHALSATMKRYWGNFVKTGDPNGTGLPSWSAYAQGGSVQELGENVGPVADRYIDAYPIIERYMQRLIEKESVVAG